MTLTVVDLYHADRVSDFAAAKVAGVVGIIHKAHQGASPRSGDPTYEIRRIAARRAGLLWGAYHFMTNEDPESQVAMFLTSAQPDRDTLMALDYEDYGRLTPTLGQVRIFLTLIEHRTGRKAVLYSGNRIKEDLQARRDPFFAAHRLWLAEYGVAPKLHPLTNWAKPWLWQYSADGVGPKAHKVAGLPGNTNGWVDLNSYDGTLEQLQIDWAS